MEVAGGTLVPRARELGDTVAQLCPLYHIGVKPVNVFPGSESSDQVSFARQRYPAILLSEYQLTDFSRYDHTSSDRISTLNISYFYRQTKLAVATIAFLAGVARPSAAASARSVPLRFSLEQNYPNPFNPSTRIRFSVPERSHVILAVYNTLGQKVRELLNGEIAPGPHEVTLDATTLASGAYFYRLQAGGRAQTRMLVVTK